MKNKTLQITLTALLLSVSNLAMADCIHKYDSGKPNTVMIEDHSGGKTIFRTYVNGKLIGQTPYPNITDEMNVYNKGEKVLSAGDKYKEYKVCVSPREA
jgi:hypothetical protein